MTIDGAAALCGGGNAGGRAHVPRGLVATLHNGSRLPTRGLHHRPEQDRLSDLLDLSELFGDFRDEGRAQLARLDEALAQAEAGTTLAAEDRAELMRALHTLKGNAAMLGLRPLQELVHTVEDAFKGAASLASLPLDVLQRSGSALRRALEVAGSPSQEDGFAPLPALRAELTDALAAPAGEDHPGEPESAADPVAAAAIHPDDDPESPEVTPAPAPPEAETAGTDADAESALASILPPPASPAAPVLAPEWTGVREETIRIPFDRLDPLLSQVDDLVRAVEGLRTWAASHADALQAAGLRRGLGEQVETLEGIAGTVRRSATSLRLVAVERVFSRFPALAADLARERGKRVRVELAGEGTELDKATADALLDPLLHLVRNAVDHGVEAPEERRAAGKPETAVIRLSAAQEGDRVRIEVEDDGAGLNRAFIEQRGRELGLLATDDPSEEEVDELLFRPGFSTRREADEISGRGVGLDVVRAAVSRMRGHVWVEDGDEGGTRFVLQLPLTVAMVPVLFFQAAGQTLAIPALDVEETLRAAPPGRVGAAETVAVRDEALPLIRVERVFGWDRAPDPAYVLVLRRGTRAAALGADRLLAQDSATVRALPAALGSPRGVSGAVVDAGGRVVLLLDPEHMLQMNVDLYRGGAGGG
jgi:two-component system chemotaxis sensor kinase CheA